MSSADDHQGSGGKLNKAISKVRNRLSRSSKSPTSPPKDNKKLLLKHSPRSDSRFFPENGATSANDNILATPAAPSSVLSYESERTDSFHAELSAIKAQNESLGDEASDLSAEIQQARVEAAALVYNLASVDTSADNSPTRTPARTTPGITPGTKASPMVTPSTSSTSKHGMSSTQKPPLWNEVQRLKELVDQKEVALNTLEAARAADALTAAAITQRASQRASELEQAANKAATELARATSQLWGARDAAKKAEQDGAVHAEAAKTLRAKAKTLEATVTSLQAQLRASEAALEAAEELAAQAQAQSQGAIATLEERLEEAETSRAQLQVTVDSLVKEKATLEHTLHVASSGDLIGGVRSTLSGGAAEATILTVGDTASSAAASLSSVRRPSNCGKDRLRSGTIATPLSKQTATVHDPDPTSESVYPNVPALCATPVRRSSTNDSVGGGSVRGGGGGGGRVNQHRPMVFRVASKKGKGNISGEEGPFKVQNVGWMIGAGLAAAAVGLVVLGGRQGSGNTPVARRVQKEIISA